MRPLSLAAFALVVLSGVARADYRQTKAAVKTRIASIERQLAAADLASSPKLKVTREALLDAAVNKPRSAAVTAERVRSEKLQALVNLESARANVERSIGQLRATQFLERGRPLRTRWINATLRRMERTLGRLQHQREVLRGTSVLRGLGTGIDEAFVIDGPQHQEGIDRYVADYLLDTFGTRRPIDPAAPQEPGFPSHDR